MKYSVYGGTAFKHIKTKQFATRGAAMKHFGETVAKHIENQEYFWCKVEKDISEGRQTKHQILAEISIW